MLSNTPLFLLQAFVCCTKYHKITAAMRVAFARFPLFWLQKPEEIFGQIGEIVWEFGLSMCRRRRCEWWGWEAGGLAGFSMFPWLFSFSYKHISFWSIIYMYILAAKLDIYYNMYMVEYLCCNCYLSLFIVDFHIATQMGEMCWIFVTWFAGCCVADHSLPINPAPPRMYKNLVKNGKTWKNYLHFTGKWNHRSFDLWLDTLKKSKNNNCDVLICLCRFRQSCAEKKKRKKCGQVSTSSSFTVGSADPTPGHIRWVGSFKMR